MTNRPTALAVLGATHGTCDTCGRVFRLRADRTTFHHLAAKALVHGYAKPQCRGSWKLPREVSPLYSETLRGKVTAAVETYLGPYSINPVPVANAVLQEIEPRLRHVEAQNA